MLQVENKPMQHNHLKANDYRNIIIDSKISLTNVLDGQ